MIDLSWIGIWLLVASVVVIVIEAALAGIWSLRLARRSQQLSRRLASEQAAVQADLARLQESLAETVVLWQPYRRLIRFLQHPLVMALMQSYTRRRSAAR
ncbi:MAG TPA: hypothetical protein VNA65_09355 [Candidatus Dormibacteraeota bacterium]|nr:hypothetical protein [Candidatus Dormibacteraeota bacterium]